MVRPRLCDATIYVRTGCCRQCRIRVVPADHCCSCLCDCCDCCDLRTSVCAAAAWQFMIGGLLGAGYTVVITVLYHRNPEYFNEQLILGVMIYLLVFWWLYFLSGIVGCCVTVDRQGILTYARRVFVLSRLYVALNLFCCVCHVGLVVLNRGVWANPLSRTNIFLTFCPLAWDWYILYLAWSMVRKLEEQRKGVFRGKPVLRNQRKPNQILELHSAHHLQLSPPPNQVILPRGVSAGQSRRMGSRWSAPSGGTSGFLSGIVGTKNYSARYDADADSRARSSLPAPSEPSSQWNVRDSSGGGSSGDESRRRVGPEGEDAAAGLDSQYGGGGGAEGGGGGDSGDDNEGPLPLTLPLPPPPPLSLPLPPTGPLPVLASGLGGGAGAAAAAARGYGGAGPPAELELSAIQEEEVTQSHMQRPRDRGALEERPSWQQPQQHQQHPQQQQLRQQKIQQQQHQHQQPPPDGERTSNQSAKTVGSAAGSSVGPLGEAPPIASSARSSAVFELRLLSISTAASRQLSASGSACGSSVGRPHNPPLPSLDPVVLSVPATATYGKTLFARVQGSPGGGGGTVLGLGDGGGGGWLASPVGSGMSGPWLRPSSSLTRRAAFQRQMSLQRTRTSPLADRAGTGIGAGGGGGTGVGFGGEKHIVLDMDALPEEETVPDAGGVEPGSAPRLASVLGSGRLPAQPPTRHQPHGILKTSAANTANTANIAAPHPAAWDAGASGDVRLASYSRQRPSQQPYASAFAAAAMHPHPNPHPHPQPHPQHIQHIQQPPQVRPVPSDVLLQGQLAPVRVRQAHSYSTGSPNSTLGIRAPPPPRPHPHNYPQSIPDDEDEEGEMHGGGGGGGNGGGGNGGGGGDGGGSGDGGGGKLVRAVSASGSRMARAVRAWTNPGTTSTAPATIVVVPAPAPGGEQQAAQVAPSLAAAAAVAAAGGMGGGGGGSADPLPPRVWLPHQRALPPELPPAALHPRSQSYSAPSYPPPHRGRPTLQLPPQNYNQQQQQIQMQQMQYNNGLHHQPAQPMQPSQLRPPQYQQPQRQPLHQQQRLYAPQEDLLRATQQQLQFVGSSDAGGIGGGVGGDVVARVGGGRQSSVSLSQQANYRLAQPWLRSAAPPPPSSPRQQQVRFQDLPQQRHEHLGPTQGAQQHPQQHPQQQMQHHLQMQHQQQQHPQHHQMQQQPQQHQQQQHQMQQQPQQHQQHPMQQQPQQHQQQHQHQHQMQQQPQQHQQQPMQQQPQQQQQQHQMQHQPQQQQQHSAALSAARVAARGPPAAFRHGSVTRFGPGRPGEAAAGAGRSVRGGGLGGGAAGAVGGGGGGGGGPAGAAAAVWGAISGDWRSMKWAQDESPPDAAAGAGGGAGTAARRSGAGGGGDGAARATAAPAAASRGQLPGGGRTASLASFLAPLGLPGVAAAARGGAQAMYDKYYVPYTGGGRRSGAVPTGEAREAGAEGFGGGGGAHRRGLVTAVAEIVPDPGDLAS